MIGTVVMRFEAASAVGGNRILAFTGEGAKVAEAASKSAPLMGVSDRMAAPGKLVDVVQGGYGNVRLGGTVEAGDLATSDAAGRGVRAIPDTVAMVRTVGRFMAPGVEGDIVPILVAPDVLSYPSI